MTVVKTKIRQDPLINKVLFNSDTVRPYRSLAARAIRMYLSQVTRTVGHSVAASPATCTKFSNTDNFLNFKNPGFFKIQKSWILKKSTLPGNGKHRYF